jgi:hypothetical protein
MFTRFVKFNLQSGDGVRPYRRTQTFLRYYTFFPFNRNKQPGLTVGLFNEFFPNVSPVDMPEAFKKNPDRLHQMVLKLSESIDARNALGTITVDPVANTTGHQNIMVSAVDHGPNAGIWMEDAAWLLRGVMSGWPNGIWILPPELVTSYLGADNKKQFIRDNIDRINTYSSLIFDTAKPASWSLKDEFLILGNGSLVRCADHYLRKEADGSIIHMGHLQTTSWHVFDGAFCWTYRWNPKYPTLVTCMGIQAGKNPWYDLDALNVNAPGQALKDFLDRASIYFLQKRANGELFERGDANVVSHAGLKLQSWVLSALDRPFLPEIRGASGPNTRSEVMTSNDIEDAKNPEDLVEKKLPSVEDAPNVTYNGKEFKGDMSLALGVPGPPTGAVRVKAAYYKVLPYLFTQATWNALKTEILNMVQKQLGSDWINMSGTELIQKFLEQQETKTAIEDYIKKYVLNPIMDSEVADVIDEVAGSDKSLVEELKTFIQDTVYSEFLVPLLSSDGGIINAIKVLILDEQVKRIDATMLRDEIDNVEKRRAAAVAEGARLKAAAQTEEVKDALAKQEEIEARARTEEKRLKEQQDDIRRYKEIRERYQERETSHTREVFRYGNK